MQAEPGRKEDGRQKQDDSFLAEVQQELARLTKELASPEQTLDLLFLAYLLKASHFGFLSFGPVTLDVRLIEDIVRRTQTGVPGHNPTPPAYSDGCLRFFAVLSEDLNRSGRDRIDELDFLIAFMRVGEGLPARVFAELGVKPEDVRRYSPAALGSSSHPEKLYSPEEAAAYLNVHVKTVRNWIRAGRLPASRLAGQRVLRIRHSDIERLLEPLSADDLKIDAIGTE